MKSINLNNGIDLKDVILEYDIACILEAFLPYSKVRSLASMAYVGLPILPTFIFTDWNNAVKNKIEHFYVDNSTQNVILRTQSQNPLYGKSVLSLPFEELPRTAISLFASGARLLFLHPSQNIHRNLYGINIDFGYFNVINNLKILLEIVGPGFIVSDLSRNGFLHEILYLTTYGAECDFTFYKRVFSISDIKYHEDIQRIIQKYGYGTLQRNNSLLLKHRESYPLIDHSYIKFIHNSIQAMRKALEYFCKSNDNAIISMSFICRDDDQRVSPIFWDIHSLQ